MKNARARSGLTIFELVIVLAVLIILAAVTLPSFQALRGNSDQQAAVDQVRGAIADARGLAISEGVPYRLAVNSDGTRLRYAPDTTDFPDTPCVDEPSAAAKCVQITFKNATAGIVLYETGEEADGDTADSWNTIAVFVPNGTCRETHAVVEVREGEFQPLRIFLRGLTGTSTMMAYDAPLGGMK